MPRTSEVEMNSLTFRIPKADLEAMDAIVDVTPRCSIPALVRRGVRLLLKEASEVGTLNMKEDPFDANS